jgi:DNA invertase Pin-like site-specific DNA recombinase
MKTRRPSEPPADTRQPIAISYLRFSSPEQRRGDSVRRQTEGTERWCERSGIPLDRNLSFRDAGRSAYHGRHRSDKAALGQFLELAKGGKIPRGSYLVIENLDRLSREDERTALRLWLDILDSGINIVQLEPETVFRHERSDMVDVLRAIIELSRGHSESRMKSARIAGWWEGRRCRLRDEGRLLYGQLPAWIRMVDAQRVNDRLTGGRLELIPERAAAVRRIFKLARTGLGHSAICRRLRQEGVAPFGDCVEDDEGVRKAKDGERWGSGNWSRSYVRLILNDRRAVGELEMPDGEPVKGYYPAVVDERTWLETRAATAARRLGKPGRLGGGEDEGCANLFGGLLRNARDGGTYQATYRIDSGKPVRVLRCGAYRDGKGSAWSFPLADFERGALSCLKEIDPAEVLPTDTSPDAPAVVDAELAWVRERKAALEAELLKGDVAVLADALRKLEARETELTGRLDEAKEEAVKPMAETWADVKTLADLLDEAKDPADVRLRLRAAIRRVVAEVWLCVVPRGRDRLARVQIHFTTGGRRDYVMLSRPTRGNGRTSHPGGLWVRSWRKEDLADMGLEQDALRDIREEGWMPAYVSELEDAPLGLLFPEAPAVGSNRRCRVCGQDFAGDRRRSYCSPQCLAKRRARKARAAAAAR